MTDVDTSTLLAGVPVPRTRDQIRQMERVATKVDEYDAIELFNALAAYLDELSGPNGFIELLPHVEREQLAARINTVMEMSDAAANPDEPPIRLDQPVNAAVTLDEGRRLARRLVRGSGWPVTLGIALLGLYDYLDQLHPGGFGRMLNSRERTQVRTSAGPADSATGPTRRP